MIVLRRPHEKADTGVFAFSFHLFDLDLRLFA